MREVLVSARGEVIAKSDSSSQVVVGAGVCGLSHSHSELLGRLLRTSRRAGFILKDKSFPEDLARSQGPSSRSLVIHSGFI